MTELTSHILLVKDCGEKSAAAAVTPEFKLE